MLGTRRIHCCGSVALAWLAVIMGLAGGVSTLGAEADVRDSLIPPGANVVLLSGLPGDVESERKFSEEMQAWLEMIAGFSNTSKVTVLCDNPETVNIPNGIGAKLLKADRTNFLALAQTFEKETNALVVIAWGHGGRQGSKPVFHVRGPRLTAADFLVVANGIPAASSHWVLMFRGSGACARSFAGKGRQILTSECDTAFTSDPVGLNVLLKAVQGSPSSSFTDLAEAFGRDAAAWYESRHLARTEEPTLWRGLEPPRRLVTADVGENSLAAVKPEESATNAPETSKSATNLPAAWKSVARVEARNYPNADGVILSRRLSYTLGNDPTIASESDEFVQVLTAEGKRLGDFDFSYAPPFEDIEFKDCEVLTPDGKLTGLDPEAIRETGEQAAGDYQLGRRKFFSLPGVVPGAVLHVRYRTEWKKFPMPHVSLEIPVGSDLPTVETEIQVSLSKDASFHFALEHISGRDPSVRQTAYGTAYGWRFENLPAHEHEVLAPPGQEPRLKISTFPDWASFAEWYERIGKLTGEVTPEIAARAVELTRNAKTDREKVAAVYDYVTGLHYVAVPLGVNSFRPHAAANVLQNQYGDCKDKANLFNTLLRAVGIESSLVLVPRMSQARDDLPGFAFNHAISRVRLGGEDLWVDTTDDVCRFGMLPPGDPGRKVLVIDGQTNGLVQLPAPEAHNHQLKLKGKIACTGTNEDVPLKLAAEASGFPDYALRSVSREAREHGASVPLLEVLLRPAAGTFALEKQNSTSPAALGEAFSWEASGAWVGGVVVESNMMTLHSPFWVPKEWSTALHRRKGPSLLNEGYPLELEEEFEFDLPADANVEGMLEAREKTDGPLKWSISWSRAGDSGMVARFEAALMTGEIKAEDVDAFQRQLRGLFGALASDATIKSEPGAK